MALRGIQPEVVQKRLKTLMYGVAGVGKTMAAISFPKPYLIDTEKGYEHQEYIDKLKANGGSVFHTTDFDELLEEVRSLTTEEHDYKTLIIDPLTVVYHNLVDKCAADRITPKDPDGTAFGGHHIAANRKMNKLIRLLIKLDMNVIITSHSKTLYGQNMTVIGETFDCFKKLDYLFDLVFEIQKKGKIRDALIKKTRVASFPESERFPFSYDEIANRYGRDILEKQAEARKLTTPEQIRIVQEYIKIFHVKPETVERYFKKGDATTWDEMPHSAMECIITHFQAKINNTKQETQHETV